MILYVRRTKTVPPCLENLMKRSLPTPENLSPEFKLWHMSLGLVASAYAIIQCAIEARDADLPKDLVKIKVPTLIIHGVDDRVCFI